MCFVSGQKIYGEEKKGKQHQQWRDNKTQEK
jgi:hypothetical protein